MSALKFASGLGRLGTESCPLLCLRAQALAAGGKEIINLGIGQLDFRTPEHIVRAGIRALEDGHHGYTPANDTGPARSGRRRSSLAQRGL